METRAFKSTMVHFYCARVLSDTALADPYGVPVFQNLFYQRKRVTFSGHLMCLEQAGDFRLLLVIR